METSLSTTPPSADTTALIRQILDGDEQAKQQLIALHQPTILRFARHMMSNEHDAQDVAQDAMLKVLKNLHRYDDKWRFSTWIIAITRNTCIDEFRRRRRLSSAEVPDVADTAPTSLEQVSEQQRAKRLHTALDKVPQLYREVLVMYHFEHLKYQEIADVLDIPIGTVMNRIFRARKKLRSVYEEIDGGQ